MTQTNFNDATEMAYFTTISGQEQQQQAPAILQADQSSAAVAHVAAKEQSFHAESYLPVYPSLDFLQPLDFQQPFDFQQPLQFQQPLHFQQPLTVQQPPPTQQAAQPKTKRQRGRPSGSKDTVKKRAPKGQGPKALVAARKAYNQYCIANGMPVQEMPKPGRPTKEVAAARKWEDARVLQWHADHLKMLAGLDGF